MGEWKEKSPLALSRKRAFFMRNYILLLRHGRVFGRVGRGKDVAELPFGEGGGAGGDKGVGARTAVAVDTPAVGACGAVVTHALG